MKARLFVPSHAAPCEDITELAQYNIDRVCEVADTILRLCAMPISFESLLQALFSEYGLTMTFEQYALVGSTIRSYLTYLKEQNRIAVTIKEGMLLWESC